MVTGLGARNKPAATRLRVSLSGSGGASHLGQREFFLRDSPGSSGTKGGEWDSTGPDPNRRTEAAE